MEPKQNEVYKSKKYKIFRAVGIMYYDCGSQCKCEEARVASSIYLPSFDAMHHLLMKLLLQH